MRRPLRTILLIALALVSHSGCRQIASPSPASNQSSGNSTQSTTNHDGMILIKGGKYLMGTADGMPYEAPAHEVTVKPFWMDRHEVTIAEFAKFVAATG
jgi:formylglycine-generating enzyme required for sulfatase activity